MMNITSTGPVNIHPLAHIVIVDDNVEANNLMRDWLKLRFTVTSFLDAESVLRILPPSDETLIFLIDYNMPGRTGMELKARLMPRFPKAKYILISGLFDDNLQAQAKAAGFHVLLPKPFGMAVLTQRIEELLGHKPRESLISLVRRQTGKLHFFSA